MTNINIPKILVIVLNRQEEKDFGINVVYNEMLNLRKLSNENPKTEEVCSRASDDLNDYYKTGDLSKIDIDDDEIECEDKDKSYFKALLSIVRTALDDTEENSNSVDPESNGGGGAPGGRRNLRNLGGVGEVDQNDIIETGKEIAKSYEINGDNYSKKYEDMINDENLFILHNDLKFGYFSLSLMFSILSKA